MTGMGGPPGPGNGSIIASFHHDLATQGALVLLLGAVLFVAWNQLRSMQYRRAVARGESFPPGAAPVAPEPVRPPVPPDRLRPDLGVRRPPAAPVGHADRSVDG